MRETSKVIMGATLVMVVCLAIVLGLVLVLLAELYCTLLLRRRRLSITSSDTNTTTITATGTTTTTTSTAPNTPPQHTPSSFPLATYYTQGVLQAPRSFLFPSHSFKENKAASAAAETKNQQSQQLHHVLDVQPRESNTSPQQISHVNASPPSSSFTSSPLQIREIPIQISRSNACNEKDCGGGGGEHFVYISNPIYDNDASRASRVDTPFETPDSSPSRLEEASTGSSSSGEEEMAKASASSLHSPPVTPPLTPMKKLPAEACSVSLRDARSLGTSRSDSASNNDISSSSSGSPCTSPSW